MTLNAAKPIIHTQMVQFNIKPAIAGTVITVKADRQNAQEEMFGTTDIKGSAAKALQLGTYTYKVIADNYYTSEGRFTLSDRSKTHIEEVTLRQNYSEITLNVNANADIYINGELKGRRSWKGNLRAGDYQVECRMADHHNSSQYIIVNEKENQTIQLNVPTPITGTLALTSKPLGANIIIDGRSYGQTPQNINDLMIGHHDVSLSLMGYKTSSRDFVIQENQTTDVNIDLPSLTPEKKEKQPKPVKEKALVAKPVGQVSALTYSGYIQAGIQAGTMIGFGANAGAYISNYNAEVYLTMTMGKEDVPTYNTSTLATSEIRVSGMMFGLKLGYGIKVSPTIRITPQLGAGVLNVKGDDVGSSAICATAGARIEIALGKNFGISLTPEGQFAVSKKDVFKNLEEASSKIKGWGTGGNLRAGVFVKF